MVNITKRHAKSFKISKLTAGLVHFLFCSESPLKLSSMHPVFRVSVLKSYYLNPTYSTSTTSVTLPREEESVEEDDSSNNEENVENYNLEEIYSSVEQSIEYSE